MNLRLFVTAGLVFGAAWAVHAAVVHRADDSAVQGDVVGLENGKVIVGTRGADGSEQRVSVPLEDVVEINFDRNAAAPATAVAATPAPAGAAAPRSNRKGVSAHFYNAQFWRSPKPAGAAIGAGRSPGDVPPDAALTAQDILIIIAAPDVSATLPTLSNHFGEDPPAEGLNKDSVSAAFTGRIRPKVSGEYTFLCRSDDDHWLLVDGKLVCSDPGAHGQRDPREGSRPDTIVPVKLEAGKDYDFLFLANEGLVDFVAIAQWIPPGESEPVDIPEDCLFAESGAPAAPADLKVSAVTGTTVTLSFKDIATSEIRYQVDRATDPEFANSAAVGTAPINATTFVDKELRKGFTYYYRVRAVNFDGQSAPVVVAATPGVPVGQQLAVAAAAAARARATAAATPAPATPAAATQAAARIAAPAPRATPVVDQKGVSARYYATQFWKSSDPRVIGGEVTIIGEPDISTTVTSLNQEWEEGSPDAKIPNDRFSTIYFGKVKSGAAGIYSFLGFSDDDHYLYVNGKLVSVDTGAHGPRDPRGGSDAAKVSTIELAANTDYDILYLQNENIGGAAASVMWIQPGGDAPEAIPEENLRTSTGVPATPSEFAADASAGGEVRLSFKDVSTNEIRYTLERSGDASFASQKVVNYLPINATTYTDPTVTKGQVYFYRLSAANFEGQSAPAVLQVTAGEKTGSAITVAQAPQPGAGAMPTPAVQAPKPDAEGFYSLFNGKDLTGWNGDKTYWSVTDGVITGTTTEEQKRQGATFLTWTGGDVADFELRLKFKAVGVNSGIQYRSRITDTNGWRAAGYQADIEDGRPVTGSLWDQPGPDGGRGTLAEMGQSVVDGPEGKQADALDQSAEQILEAIKQGDWNDYTITAVGNKLTHAINGVTTMQFVDDHPSAAKSGVIAFEVDHYMAGTIQYKDVRLKPVGGPMPAGIAAAPPAAPVQPAAPATAPAQAPLWTVQLAGGDRLTGAVARWTDSQIVVTTGAGDVAVPVRRLREAWRPGDAVSKAKALVQPGAADDTAFVLAENNEVRPVRGVVKGIEGDSLNFRFDDRDRKIALDRLVGVVLSETEDGKAQAFERSFHQSVVLASGDSLSGAWVGLAAGVLELRTPWDAKLSVPVEKVASLKCRNGRLVYLSDLPPADVEQVPYFDRMLAYQVDRSLTGGRLKLSDGEYDKGLAVHSRTVLRYDTAGAYARLKGKVGFQDPEGKLGSAAVRIVGDGKPLLDRPEARGDQSPEEFDVDVTGVKVLSLEVDFGRGQDVGDRVVWANPRLLRADMKK